MAFVARDGADDGVGMSAVLRADNVGLALHAGFELE